MKKKNHPEAARRFILSDPEMPNEINSFLRSQGYAISRPQTVHIDDIYLDTFDWRLFRKNLSLRFRKAEKRFRYTLKPLESTGEIPAPTGFIETEADGNPAEPWKIPASEISAEISKIIFPRRLVVQVTTHIRRIESIIRCPDGTEVSMAFDTVSLQSPAADKRMARLWEIRLAWKNGAEENLEALEKEVTTAFHLTASTRSILKRAVELLAITFPSKNPPPELTVQLHDRLDTAVNKILLFQFQRLNENIPGTMADIDTEFVHQARVATRKMRSLLRLLEKAYPQRTGEFFTGELYWLGALFGSVRDLDVFSLNMDKTRSAILHAPDRAMDILLRQINLERSEKLAALREGLTSARWRIFALRLSTFARRKSALHPQAPLALLTVEQRIPTIMAGLYKGLITRGNRILEKPELENFHRLRIQFKKIRYASEFFNPAFRHGLSSFITDIVKIQDCLGELQDTVFTRELIRGFMKKWKGSVIDPRVIFILGEVYQLQDEIARARQNEFYKLWESFAHPETELKLNAVLGIPAEHLSPQSPPERS